MRTKIESNDYIGFTFNGIHSSQLGIVRTSDGSRFNENLLPTIQDKTVQVPGGDGTYYFGSYYTQKPINITFAFDDLTEQEIVELKRWLGDKKIHELIFDETPYKAYQAKITGSATIKHIPFGTTGERIYKGEGSIQFTAYQPFARSVFKFTDEVEVPNKEEWLSASRLKNKSFNNGQSVITYNELKSNNIYLYNAGDIDTHFQLRLNTIQTENERGEIIYVIPPTVIELYDSTNSKVGALRLKKFVCTEQEPYVKINSKLNIIEGYTNNNTKSGRVYNSAIVEGSFFKIPVGDSLMTFSNESSGGNGGFDHIDSIEYDYYYI